MILVPVRSIRSDEAVLRLCVEDRAIILHGVLYESE